MKLHIDNIVENYATPKEDESLGKGELLTSKLNS